MQAVLAGRSLTETLAETAPELRAATQAVTFHAMRRLGLALEVRRILVQRPPGPLFDAVLLVSLALLDTAVQAREYPASVRRDQPVYAEHTVVDQAVEAVAAHRGLRAYKGLLNATLRNFLRRRAAILEQAGRQPQAKWNHPGWWIDELRRAYPGQWERLLQSADIPGPMVLRVNARRSSVDGLMAAFEAAGIGARPVGQEGLMLPVALPLRQIPGFDEGWWSVQDGAAQMAAQILDPRDGMRVLDACAAPGGKTAHLLERADIELVALDSDPARLERVTRNLERLGLAGPGVSVRCADAADLDAWWDGRPFDAVLADVPCTASGIVRRHPDIRWLRRKTDLARTAGLQRKIVDALWKTVKPGGHLLYATCSIFPQEGEMQAGQFIVRHGDALRLPAPGQLLPSDEGGDPGPCDGFFYALFAKRA